MQWHTQQGFAVRLEWGLSAIEHLAKEVECVIIIDVMSFSTCVSIAVDRDALIYPWPWKDASATQYAEQLGAEAASTDRRLVTEGYSLSPCSMQALPAAGKLVLPSPNGSAISFQAREYSVAVYCACFRNIMATVRACSGYQRILIVACGERWPDGALRPATEDYIAAGAIIAGLSHMASPEAAAAAAAWRACGTQALQECASARELIGRGFTEDVALCLEIDVSDRACCLMGNVYIAA